MLVADVAQAPQIALGRQQHAGGASDRLDDHCRDGRGIVQRDESLQVVGQFRAVLRHPAREGVARQVMGVADMVGAGQQRPEALAVADNAADRDAAEVDAVVAALAADQPGSRSVAAGTVVADRHLECRLDGFGARIGEEDLVESVGGELYESFRQLEGLRVPHVEGRREIHFGGLLCNRLHDARPGVAGVDAPQPGDAVEDLAALGRPVVHARGLGKHPRVLLELPVGRERHPERVHRRLHRGGGRCGLRRHRGGIVFVHGFAPWMGECPG